MHAQPPASGRTGSAPPSPGSGAGRLRPGVLALGVTVLLVGAVLIVLAARGLRTLDPVQGFLTRYPGATPLPADAPIGFPTFVAWQHGLNAFFLLFVIRSGWRLHRGGRPTTFWVRRNGARLATRNPPVRIGIDLWSHYVGDTLWVLNGVIFLVLIFATGQWLRLVPTDWGVVPNAVSAALQYASLDWPVANGWIDYNALQTLSYFVVVFVAGPLAVVTGLRAAPGFAARLRPLDRAFPLRMTKRLHYWTMVFFAAFIVVHVFLVLATGAINNLNHMYAVRNDQSPAGAIVLAGSLLVTLVAVLLLRPPAIRAAAARTGTVVQRPQRPAR